MKFLNNLKSSIIIEIKGSQYSFEKNKIYTIENLNVLANKDIFLNKVLLFSKNGKLYLGTPYLKGIKIQVKVLNNLTKPKIITYKMKPKKGIRKKSGFLKEQTKILITGIFLNKKL